MLDRLGAADRGLGGKLRIRVVRIDAGLVQDDQGSAGDAVWDHAALVQTPPWKTVFGLLSGIAAKPSWKPFKAGCRSGDGQVGFSVCVASGAFYRGFRRGSSLLDAVNFGRRRNYRKPIGINY